MSGYIESHTENGIARAYGELCGRPSLETPIQNPASIPAPPSILNDPAFTPRCRFIANELRRLFSGEQGVKAAAVLSTLKGPSFVVCQREEVDGRVQFGCDGCGPYRVFTPKRKPFRRRPKPMLTRVSIEELCLRSEDPNRVYQILYLLINMAIIRIIGSETW